MTLLRLFLIAAAVWLVAFFIRRLLRQRRDNALKQQPPGDMVRCAHCGLHLPKSEALRHDDLYFCSRQHLERHDPS